MQPQERACELVVGKHRLGKGSVGRQARLLVTREVSQGTYLDDHQASRPRFAIDGCTAVSLGGVPGDKLARHDQAAFTPSKRTHRLPGDNAEDVFAPRFDNVA